MAFEIVSGLWTQLTVQYREVSIFFLIVLFYVYGCLLCMYVCAPSVCSKQVEGIRAPGTGVTYRLLYGCYLGAENQPRPSGRTASGLNVETALPPPLPIPSTKIFFRARTEKFKHPLQD